MPQEIIYAKTKPMSMKAWFAINGKTHFKPQFITLTELKPHWPTWREIAVALKPPKWLWRVS